MKTTCCSLLLLLLLTEAFAQVSGKVSLPDGQPIPYANVLLLKSADSSLVKAALTNEQGAYQLEDIGAGSYILRFSYIGYITAHSAVFVLTTTDSNRNFGNQVLTAQSKQLSEVVVRAERPLLQQQQYGMVVNVGSSVLTKGSSVMEVLERSPGVAIDRRASSIALNGKNGVMVMVNGKLMRLSGDQLLTLLQGMSANDIEKIELMTTPPARYDAEGSAGMINIVLKKNRDQGSISLTGGYGWAEKASGSASLAHNIGNTNVYGAYTYSRDRSNVDWYSLATDNVPVLGGYTASLARSDIQPTMNSHNVNAGFDARIRSYTLGGSVSYNYSHVSEHVVNHAEYDVETGSKYILDADIKGVNKWHNLISSLFAEKTLAGGGQLNIAADHLYYTNNKPTNVYSIFLDQNGNPPPGNDPRFSPDQRGTSNSRIQVAVGKIDYMQPLSPALKLETGVKGAFTKNTSLSGIESLQNGQWVSRSTTNNHMIMKENMWAAYTSLNAQLSARVELSAGVRYEYSRTKMNELDTKAIIADRKLGKLFPTLFLTWKANERSDLLLSYTKRISRPTYNDLASFVVYGDPTSVETGNPLLRPTITNTLKIGMNYRQYNFSILASRDDYPIARYQISANAAGDLMVLSPQNLIYQDNLSFQTNMPVKISSWYTMNYGFTGGWRQFKLDYTARPVEKSYLAYAVNFSQLFTLPRSYAIEISGWYNSTAYDGSKKVNGYGAVNGGVKKELSRNRGTLQLSVLDIFKTIRIVNNYGAITEEAFNLKSRVPFSTESTRSQIIKVSYSRSFGTTRANQRTAESGSQDERARIRKF
ncbi:TonB-dependent receptor [Chitinophaga agrisoli]|uniref:TonB-dependent receptor n=1 Tax=Chitinophaga agrisoli TaxID=2607653 RepID=A0A5B2VM92_9BACT|nr:TonB-dependent receptor [Chitinophaga agrisoli]KAA2239367.1 TonB-dependent receptor [Chitinophaga agrisoli]